MKRLPGLCRVSSCGSFIVMKMLGLISVLLAGCS